MAMSIARLLSLAIIFLIVAAGLAGAANKQDPTPTDQQDTLTPILTQITAKSCPQVTEGASNDAASDIKNLKRDIPGSIQELLEAWLDYSKWYKHLHWGISVAIILFGALATALQDGVAWWARWKTMAAVFATVFAGINTTLAPGVDYRKFDEAFVVLNTAKAAYMTNPAITLCDLGKAVATGESIIHKGE